MKKPCDLRQNEVIDLLTPFIDLGKNQCSLWKLYMETNNVIKKLELTGEPLRLTYQGKVIAILSDPKVYEKIEKRRTRLIALINIIQNKKAFKPRTKRLSEFSVNLISDKFSPDLRALIKKIEHLKDGINDQKCRLYDREEELAKAERQLHNLKTI